MSIPCAFYVMQASTIPHGTGILNTTMSRLGKIFKIIIIVFFVLLIVYIFFLNITSPSNDRNWNDDQTILPYAEIGADTIKIYNIRNFTYRSTQDYDANYYDKEFNINELKKVWYVVEPFSGIPGSAHTLLSFEFENDQFIAISVEIRKEKGESYHPLRGLLNQYELMYVIADERDVVKLRSNFRKDLVYVYPVVTSEEKVKALFIDMLTRANSLRSNPEFYNTLTNTCTTNIVAHVNKITPKKIPLLNFEILLPEHSDKLAHKIGLLDTTLPINEARQKYLINERAELYGDAPNFSRKIREDL